MIEVRRGYDFAAAKAMYEAYKDSPEPRNKSLEEFKRICKKAGAFFGFYDPEPVGGLLYDGPYVHAAILPRARKQCDEAFRSCVDYALERVPFILATVHSKNLPAIKLVERMGFVLLSKDEWSLFRRDR